MFLQWRREGEKGGTLPGSHKLGNEQANNIIIKSKIWKTNKRTKELRGRFLLLQPTVERGVLLVAWEINCKYANRRFMTGNHSRFVACPKADAWKVAHIISFDADAMLQREELNDVLDKLKNRKNRGWGNVNSELFKYFAKHEFLKSDTIPPLYVFNHCTQPSDFKIQCNIILYNIYVHDVPATEFNPYIYIYIYIYMSQRENFMFFRPFISIYSFKENQLDAQFIFSIFH